MSSTDALLRAGWGATPGGEPWCGQVLLPGKPETCVGGDGLVVWGNSSPHGTALQEGEEREEPGVGRLTRLPRGPAGLSRVWLCWRAPAPDGWATLLALVLI